MPSIINIILTKITKCMSPSNISLSKIKKLIIRFVKHRRIEFLYVIIVTALTCAALYSTYDVINDYVNNNTMTKVLVKTTDNILPFVHYFSVKYYFYPVFKGRSIIPDTWHLNKSEVMSRNLFPIGSNASKAISRIADRTNKSSFYTDHRNSTNLPLDSQCDIAVIAGILYELDRYFWMSGESISQVQYAAENSDFNNGQPLSVNFSDLVRLMQDFLPISNLTIIESRTNTKLISAINSFVENRYGEELVDVMLSKLTPFKYLKYETNDFVDLPGVLFFDDMFIHNQVVTSIPLDFFADKTKKRARKWPIVIGFMPTDYTFDIGNFSTNTEKLQLFFAARDNPDNIIYSGWVKSARQYTQIDITVRNNGVYDTTDTRKQEECAECGDLLSVDDCVWKCKINLQVDICQCIPFIRRRSYRMDPKRKHLPICTIEHYANCSKSDDRFNGMANQCSPDIFKPCVISRNNYVVNVLYLSENKISTNYTPKMVFRFNIDEKTYVEYHDEFQNSFLQMLGQLGGNLGVFLSFSLLGAWQFLVFIHLTYNKYKHQKQTKIMDDINRTHGVLASWLRVAQLTVESRAQTEYRQRYHHHHSQSASSVQDHDVDHTSDQDRDQDQEDISKKIVELRSEIEKERKKEKLEMEEKIKDLKSIISSLEKRLQSNEVENKKQEIYSA